MKRGPKSQFSADRKTDGGKGDADRTAFSAYQNALFWKRSKCHNAVIRMVPQTPRSKTKIPTCEKCGKALQPSDIC